jgi:Uma2 family endonuclease
MSERRLYTAAEYGALDLDDGKTELVRGIIVYEVRDQPRGAHSYTAGQIGYAIQHYLETHPIGLLLPEWDCQTGRGPDTVRRPDVSYISHARAKGVRDSEIPYLTPDLAVEVLSPSNRAGEMATKMAEYFANGTRLVWLADPKKRTVAVHAPDARPYILGNGEFLDGGDVLPGFRVAVNRLFGWTPSEAPGE